MHFGLVLLFVEAGSHLTISIGCAAFVNSSNVPSLDAYISGQEAISAEGDHNQNPNSADVKKIGWRHTLHVKNTTIFRGRYVLALLLRHCNRRRGRATKSN